MKHEERLYDLIGYCEPSIEEINKIKALERLRELELYALAEKIK